MTTRFQIQDPDDTESLYLNEAIVAACDGAIRGAGAFAFASRGGADLLLLDPGFERFLAQGTFDLVVGIDEITDVAAVERLAAIAANHPNLSVSVFVHNRPRTLFHPKFSWLRQPAGGTAVVGSGNLTEKGLSRNWEAFIVAAVDEAEALVIETHWSRWKERNAARLLAIDNPLVRARAEANRRVNRRSRPRNAEGYEREAPLASDARMLIAEIPRSRDRWKQANFDREHFFGFFQVRPGTHETLLLWPVADDGTVGTVEHRPSVSVSSNNHRIELGAATGLEYPDGDERPIGVFLRVETRRFRYRLLMPDGADYAAVNTYLRAQWTGRADRMRRIEIDTAAFRTQFPDFMI